MTALMLRRLAALLIAAAMAGSGCTDDASDGTIAGSAEQSRASITVPEGPSTTDTTEAPDGANTPAAPPLGAELTTPVGNTVTVHRVEAPLEPNRDDEIELEENLAFAGIEAEFCAAAGSAVRGVSEGDFFVVTDDERVWAAWGAEEYLKDPRFPASATAAPGECVRGWVTFAIREGAAIETVRWDLNGGGAGPFLEWQVAQAS